MIFYDRKHAGSLLAKKLKKYKSESVVILALPRGGVPVAAEVAAELGLKLDVLIVRKIGAPFQPELAVGAICEEEDPVWNVSILEQLRLMPDELENGVQNEKAKVQRQIREFRQSNKLPSLYQKTVIIVDDGLATGTTMAAAIQYLKKKEAGKIVVAIPVAAESSAASLRLDVDEVIVLEEREDLNSIGQWYMDFSQVSDKEVIELLERTRMNLEIIKDEIEIPLQRFILKGDLATFTDMQALIIFSHGSGSSRKSPRNQEVARYLNENGFGTLLFDLLTERESEDRRKVFNIDFLSARLVSVTRWLRKQPGVENIPLGFFGASTGAAAALKAASQLTGDESIYALVSRGGRPDLAGEALKLVRVPVLLLVGGQDDRVIELNREAQSYLTHCKLSIVPGATHLFEEPGALEEVCLQATKWFHDCLPSEVPTIQDHLVSRNGRTFGLENSSNRTSAFKDEKR